MIVLVVDAARPGMLTNAASMTGTVIDTDPANNTAGVTVSVAPVHGDLAVIATGGPDPVIVGSNVAYTIRVINNGPNTAAGVVLTYPLPGDMTYVSGTLSQGTLSQLGSMLTADLGSLASDAAAIR